MGSLQETRDRYGCLAGRPSFVRALNKVENNAYGSKWPGDRRFGAFFAFFLKSG
jgi:hypothetical protein